MPEMSAHVVVAGGGAAGIEAAGMLARSGIRVTLIEKETEPGGHLKGWYHLFPDRRDSREVISYLSRLISHENIDFIPGETVAKIDRKGLSFSVTTGKGGSFTADAVLIATGFDMFRCERKEEYGYGIYDNVITSAELEVMFRNGEIKTVGGIVPSKLGMIHCVGSRDEKVGNLYCSKLCCVTAVKQAMEIKEYISDARIFCFYMDMRMGGAMYEELYREAQEKYGINFIRGKVSEVSVSIDNRLIVKSEDTLAGRPLKMEVDMLVLMAGMEISDGGKKLALASGLKTGENRFLASADNHYGSNRSHISGIFYAGTCTAPMNVTDTISHARGAAAEIIDYLRNTGRHNG
ncbi:MAG TPA: FAD-dependent oxidoreductase [Bacteroidales bacterium]|nr:FAD-dependent oxidoreductase [Bacteroidales bacterium]HQG77850.1 FAD-dependent oxidoreductase [Bacteroidales bacterium]